MKWLLLTTALAAGVAAEETLFIEPELIHLEPLGEIELPKGKILADTVMLTVTIRTDGTVKSVKIWSSSGDKKLDALAAEAAKKCLFRPAYQNGEPVEYDWQIYYRLSTYKRIEHTSDHKKADETGSTHSDPPSPPPAKDP